MGTWGHWPLYAVSPLFLLNPGRRQAPPGSSCVPPSNVMTVPWWQSFLFTRQQPLRTHFPRHQWCQRLNTQLLQSLQVRLFLFVFSSKELCSLDNERMNEYVSLRIFSITDDLCNDTQSRPPWRLSPRKGGVLQQSVENTVMGEHRMPGVPK